MKKLLNIYEIIFFTLYILSLFLQIGINNITKNILFIIIISAMILNTVISIVCVKYSKLSFSNRDFLMPIIYIAVSTILSLPGQILIVSGNFIEQLCYPMVFLHLIVIISIVRIYIIVYKYLEEDNKGLRVLINIIFVAVMSMLYFRTILIYFGFFWVENFKFVQML